MLKLYEATKAAHPASFPTAAARSNRRGGAGAKRPHVTARRAAARLGASQQRLQSAAGASAADADDEAVPPPTLADAEAELDAVAAADTPHEGVLAAADRAMGAAAGAGGDDAATPAPSRAPIASPLLDTAEATQRPACEADAANVPLAATFAPPSHEDVTAAPVPSSSKAAPELLAGIGPRAGAATGSGAVGDDAVAAGAPSPQPAVPVEPVACAASRRAGTDAVATHSTALPVSGTAGPQQGAERSVSDVSAGAGAHAAGLGEMLAGSHDKPRWQRVGAEGHDDTPADQAEAGAAAVRPRPEHVVLWAEHAAACSFAFNATLRVAIADRTPAAWISLLDSQMLALVCAADH